MPTDWDSTSSPAGKVCPVGGFTKRYCFAINLRLAAFFVATILVPLVECAGLNLLQCPEEDSLILNRCSAAASYPAAAIQFPSAPIAACNSTWEGRRTMATTRQLAYVSVPAHDLS
jgi:hypothetical protein